MPLYEYKCEECSEEKVVFQTMDADPPDCGKCRTDEKEVKMKKKISKPSFVLKGNHWAKDNYGLQDKV
ncbi:MAG: FmdB family zinc ribbon protein [Vampirovibrionia bacterium]